MDALWTEFRSSPMAYLHSHRITMDTLIANMIQVCVSWSLANDYLALVPLPSFTLAMISLAIKLSFASY